ncbi:hypothetical protein [Methylobacterium sp. E-045]|uniref:hypothetical protein n=1 Tax=Methylobacterium sp. E-045 TaxID=2836575 RepID=UPI001FB8DAC3|nr:hypothetical protein [Methylobacterium sp. E-045]MCJ2129198.1 hypothetical protein [Methylobacterium sp. E-045]
MKFGGLVEFGRAAVGTLLRKLARLLMAPLHWMERLADRIDPRLVWPPGPPGSPPREWHPRLWDRCGGRTPNEPRP